MSETSKSQRALMVATVPALAVVVALQLALPFSVALRQLGIVEFHSKLTRLSLFLALVTVGLFADILVRGGIYRGMIGGIEALADRPRAFVWTTAMVAVIALASIARLTLDAFPNSGDEYAYLYQAETFRAGRLWNEPPPAGDFFHTNHIGLRDGKWVSIYPPGWPMVLVLGGTLGIPYWLVNPLLGAGFLVALFNFARRLYDSRVAVVTVLVTGLSSFYLFTSSSYFSHALCALYVLAHVHFGCRYLESGGRRHAVAAALFIAGAFGVRYYTAVVCILPWVAVVLFRRRWRGFADLAIAAASTLPIAALLAWYHHSITGNPLVTPMTWAEGIMVGFTRGHTLLKGFAMTIGQLTNLASWTSPVIVLAYAGCLALGRRRPGLRFHDVILAALVIGYIFFHSNGATRWGPRYYYEGFAFAVLLPAARLFGRRASSGVVAVTALRYAFLLGTLAWLWVIPFNLSNEHRVIQERQDLYRQVEAAGIDNAIVLIAADTCPDEPMWAEDLTRNGITFDREVLYVLDHGPERRRELSAAFPERTLHLYEREEGALEGTVRPLE